MVSVAAILEQELDFTIKEWLSAVNLIPELAKIPLSDAERTAHLPKLFNDVIERLRETETPISTAATEHGARRFAQGYSASMLVEESRIFQVTTFRTLHTHHRRLNKEQVLLDVMTIADEADSQLAESVRSFMAAAKAL
jgi:hypothetical protein